MSEPDSRVPAITEPDSRVAAALRTLRHVPAAAGAVMFIRHAERPELPKGELGAEVPLTAAGMASARRLGAQLRDRLRRVHTSPVRRCQLTAAELLAGAERAAAPIVVPHLGEPGLFVQDGRLAWPQFLEHGVQTMARKLSRCELLPGFRPAAQGVQHLLLDPLASLPPAGGLDAYITHDYILAVTASLLLGQEAPWPDFLTCLCVWRERDRLVFSFAEQRGFLPPELALDPSPGPGPSPGRAG